jgi:hypothetical protein
MGQERQPRGRGESRVSLRGQPARALIRHARQVAQVRSNPHSPSRFRVDGALYNIPEFAEAFNCSATAKARDPGSETHAPLNHRRLLAAQSADGEAMHVLVNGSEEDRSDEWRRGRRQATAPTGVCSVLAELFNHCKDPGCQCA